MKQVWQWDIQEKVTEGGEDQALLGAVEGAVLKSASSAKKE